MAGPDRQPTEPRIEIDEAVLAGLYTSDVRPNHDGKWHELEAADAALARLAVVRAGQVAEQGIDPRDAYLQGATDVITALRRQQALDGLVDFDPDAELRQAM